MMTNYGEEEHMIAATQHILKALGANKNLSDHFRRALAEIDSLLSEMVPITESPGKELLEMEELLKHSERKIMSWESNPCLLWDSGPVEASKYLQAVFEIQTVVESLGSLPVTVNENRKKRDLVCRGQCALQIAMSRLEEELYHVLVQHKEFIEPQYMSFRLRTADVVYDESFVSLEDEVVGETSTRRSTGSEYVEYTVDLVDPRVIPHIKSIANAMFTSNYGQEFCDAFIAIRKDALAEYCSTLETEKLSIEDVLKLEWNSLNCKIKNWMCAMKIIIRVYLASEKRLCEQILAGFGSVCTFCFVHISKASILCLLTFGEAIAMGPHKPEKLFRLLDVYEVLADLHSDVNGLFLEEAGSFIRNEFHELMRTLGVSARETFLKFRNAIASDPSLLPFPGGGIHHLTKYVMNYIKVLIEYHNTLNLLLEDQDYPNVVAEIDGGKDESSSTTCPLASQLQSITSTLESNLTDKSKLYKDDSLDHIFLMNNIHYMVEKVKGSGLQRFLGDEWIRKHKAICQQHATSYVRSTWGSVVSLLRDDRKMGHKERCRRFSNAFEEVYKRQTAWCIPDLQLREDLQILTSQKVILAYRAFLGKNNSDIREKYIKYTTDDLEKLLLDLFAGSPRSLRNSRRW